MNCFAQDPFSPYNDAKPKGKIDSVIIISGNAEGKHAYIYNKRGQLIEVTWYRDDVFPDGIGRVLDTMKTVFTYGANHHLISSTSIYKGKKSLARYEYSSRKYGYAIRAIASRDGDSLVYEMRFNHKGQIIQSGYYRLSDLEFRRTGSIDYKYDENGNMIERAAYYDLGPYRLFYRYNSSGDMIALSWGDSGDKRGSTYTYPKYDQMHTWTEREFLNGYGFRHTSYRRITYYK
jgi:YD repeat-containing protein